MTNIFDPKKAVTIRVKTDPSDFVIEDTETGKKVIIPQVTFYSSAFKYEGDFERAFLNVFAGKVDIFMSSKARAKMIEILNFNRIDW